MTLALVYAALAMASITFVSRRRWLAAAPGVVPEQRTLPLHGLAFFGILVAQIMGAWLVVTALGDAAGARDIRAHALIMLGGYAVQVPVAMAVARSFGRLQASPWAPACAGAIGIVLAWPILQTAFIAASTVQKLVLDAGPPSLGHETLTMLARGPSETWAWVIRGLVVVAAPFVEEVAYRGALQGFLRGAGMRGWSAIALTSVVFVVMHLSALPVEGAAGAVAELFVLSMALGLLRERTQSFVACIVAHGLFNAANLVLAAFVATVPTP